MNKTTLALSPLAQHCTCGVVVDVLSPEALPEEEVRFAISSVLSRHVNVAHGGTMPGILACTIQQIE